MNSEKMSKTLTLTVLLALTSACGLIGPNQTSIDDQIQQSVDATLAALATDIPAHPTDTPAPSPYWNIHTDNFTGLSFAAPCFWDVQLTEGDPNTMQGGYMAADNIPENYAMQYPLAYPRGSGLYEAGGIKVEFVITNLPNSGYEIGTTPLDYLTAQDETDSVSTLLGTEQIEVNGQAGYLVTAESNFGVGQYYFFGISEQLLLLLNFFPKEALNHPDLQGIINSISLSPEVPVVVPSHTPSAPLPGLAASCIPEYAESSAPPKPQNFNEGKTTECGVHSFIDLGYLTDTVTTSLQNRDIGTLTYSGFISEPFTVGYWQSEGVTLDPLQASSTLTNQLLPPDPSTLTFTTDRAQFPPLFGTPPEAMFAPDFTFAEIQFSTGWGPDGQGAALLYYMQDSCGGYFWHGMVYASDRHFDK